MDFHGIISIIRNGEKFCAEDLLLLAGEDTIKEPDKVKGYMLLVARALRDPFRLPWLLSGRLTEGVMKNLLLFWVELGLAIGVASAMVSIFVGIPVAVIFGLFSEDFVTASNEAENLVTLAIKLLIVVPITKLATADINRRLEGRSPVAVLPDNSQKKA